MSRIAEAFGRGKAFAAFVTGGDPSIDDTYNFVLALEKAGADLIEIGIPFSDPIAEGEVIQAANIRALNGGATVEKLFALVKKLRLVTRIPIVFLTYLNPVFKNGYADFARRCKDAGVDGLIIPDLPFEEQGELKPICRAAGIDLISLIAPTSKDRTARIARDADGFLYIVSSLGVTGTRAEITTDIGAITAAARAVSDIPCAVGFGIHTPEQAKTLSRSADGVIVGSAIVKIIAEHGADAVPYLTAYAASIKGALGE